MPVIKHHHAESVMKQAVVLDLGDIKKQAEAIVQAARHEAEQIVRDGRASAEAELNAAREAAQREGFEAGRVEGWKEGEQAAREATLDEFRPRVDELIERWQSAVERWDTEHRDMLLAAREEVVALALEMARRVVYRVIDADPTVVQDQVAEAMTLIGRATRAEVSVHPDDRSMLESILPDLMTQLGRSEQAAVRDDETLERGGCRVRTSAGAIDAQVTTQLDRIAEALLAAGTVERWRPVREATS